MSGYCNLNRGSRGISHRAVSVLQVRRRITSSEYFCVMNFFASEISSKAGPMRRA